MYAALQRMRSSDLILMLRCPHPVLRSGSILESTSPGVHIGTISSRLSPRRRPSPLSALGGDRAESGTDLRTWSSGLKSE